MPVYGFDPNSENPDGAPSSFCIVRVTARGPCIVIKVAFLGGTAGHIRHQVSDIRTVSSCLVETGKAGG